MATTPSKERRGAPRRRAHYKVRFWNQELDATGFVTDLSDTGLFIETRKPPGVGTRVHLEIYLTDMPFLAEGQVARVQTVSTTLAAVRQNGFGLRLVTWPEVAAPNRTGAKAALASLATGAGTEQDPLVFDLTDPRRLQTVYANEICRGGLFVPTRAVGRLGAQVVVSLRLPASSAALLVRATLVHCSDNPEGWGLQLVDVPELRGRLGAVLAALVT